MGSYWEKVDEAQAWIQRILSSEDCYIIEDKHILYLGKKEHNDLSLLQENLCVSISEIVTLGKAHLEIRGKRAGFRICFVDFADGYWRGASNRKKRLKKRK